MRWRDFSPSARPAPINFDVLNDNGGIGSVVCTARLAGNFLDQLNAGSIALAKDGVLAVERRSGDFGDEELRAVGIRAGIGVGKAAWLIEGEIRQSFILELEAQFVRSRFRPDRRPES